MSHAVIHADALTYLRGNRWLVQNGYIPKAHAILCDPPYALPGGFMSKDWDNFNTPQAYQAWVSEWAGLLIDYVYPGALGLFFGGTRTYHRLATGLEDAGWEITDCMMWVQGQGFPKSASIGKLLDKEAGAERPVLGKHPRPGSTRPRTSMGDGWQDAPHITAPATPLAARWEGYGTALKPSFEPIVIARKPLSFVPFSAIMAEMNTLIGGLLCLSLLSVNDAEKVSTFSPSELPTDAASASVVTLVGLLHGAKSGALYEAMGTFNSPETVSTCLNTALLWNGILAAVSENGSTYTTSTASSLTTALKICKSLILESIPESITQDVIRPLGQLLPAPDAESSLSAGSGNTNDIPMRFAAAIASLPAKLASSIASGVGSLSTPAVKSISTVLNRALTELPTISGESLQPDYLPVVVARAPRGKHTYAALAREFGTGALAIDAARIGTAQVDDYGRSAAKADGTKSLNQYTYSGPSGLRVYDPSPSGRWPANFALVCACEGDEHDADCPVAVLGEQSGELTSGKREPSARTNHDTGWHMGTNGNDASVGTAARFFYQAKAAAWEREAGLHGFAPPVSPGHNLSTNACARCGKRVKANGSGDKCECGDLRETVKVSNRANVHPTVKPIRLAEYLARLILPPELDTPRRLLVPFAGSGSEMIGARLAGWDAVTGIERESEYVALADARLAWWAQFASYDEARAAYEKERKANPALVVIEGKPEQIARMGR